MADDVLKELMTSPLEDGKKPERPKRSGPAMGLPVLAGFGIAALLGAAITIVSYLTVAEDDPVAVTTTTVAQTTTTTVAPEAGFAAGLPEGYRLIDDRIGIRAERILERPGGSFITFTTAVINVLDADGSSGFQGGLWIARLSDGTEIESTIEAFDPLARGTVSVFFPGDFEAESLVSVDLVAQASRATLNGSVASEGLLEPLAEGEVREIPLVPSVWTVDEDISITFAPLVLKADRASIAWSLDSVGVATAAIDHPIMRIDLTEGIVQDDAVIAHSIIVDATQQTGAVTLFHPSVPAAALTSEGGEFFFDPPTPADFPLDQQFEVQMNFDIVWNVYEDAGVSIPLDGVPVAKADA